MDMAAGQIQDLPVEGPNDFDEQDENADGLVEHPAFLAFHHSELAEEVFVDLNQGIAPDLAQTADHSQQFQEHGAPGSLP